MSRIDNEKSCASPAPLKAEAHVDAATNDWNKETAEFVAAYNELIEAGGAALEEYRLF